MDQSVTQFMPVCKFYGKIILQNEIWGFQGVENINCGLLGCDTYPEDEGGTFRLWYVPPKRW
jgi:hypothetical protein